MNEKIVRQPIYQQLATILKNMIAEQQLECGCQFPSEREICTQYNVSRATANKAICSLVAEGFLTYKKGIGTFVASKPLSYDLSTLISFTKKTTEAGKTPSTSVITFKKIMSCDVPASIFEMLSPANDKAIYYFERVRFADGVPVIYEKRYLCSEFIHTLTKTQLENSLYELIEKKSNIKIKSAKQTISAVTPNIDEAKILDISTGCACFRINSVGILDNDKPVWYESTLYRGDVYEMQEEISVNQAFLKGMIYN